MRLGTLAAAVVATALLGCGSREQNLSSSKSRRAVTGPAASCDRPSPIRNTTAGIPEVQGRGEGAQLWGLIMARRFPIVAGRDGVKIVWRMTGSGPLKLAAYDSRGGRLGLAWGPEPHGGSTYQRPGDEWGSGFQFWRPGCYRLTARRTHGTAEVWLRVGPSH
jgi:hypothetical protein